MASDEYWRRVILKAAKKDNEIKFKYGHYTVSKNKFAT